MCCFFTCFAQCLYCVSYALLSCCIYLDATSRRFCLWYTKYNALSYFFLQEAGPLEEKGMVMSVLDKSFDVFVLKFGVVKRVYCEVMMVHH